MTSLRSISHYHHNVNPLNWSGICVIPAYPPKADEFQLDLDEVLGPLILENCGGRVSEVRSWTND